MDTITVVAITAGLILPGIFSYTEGAFEKLLNPILRLIGLQSSSGPIDITVIKKDKFIALTLKNNGKGKAKMVAILVTDEKGKKVFPIPYLHESEVGEEMEEKKPKNSVSDSYQLRLSKEQKRLYS